MTRRSARIPLILTALLGGMSLVVGCKKDVASTTWDAGFAGSETSTPLCSGGTDVDGDGYGDGCQAGKDCDDNNVSSHPGAPELCDGLDNDCDNEIDEGALNACGTCAPGCDPLGDTAFPMDPSADPNLVRVEGVALDSKGDIVLTEHNIDFNFIWIANTYDKGNEDTPGPGTVSKIDTVKMKEVARYYSVTCSTKGSNGECLDIHGKTIDPAFSHTPSRTAVDLNFDVWVANRAFSGQPSATKIANASTDCVDRNGNGTIDTSADNNGDGIIELDCNADGNNDDSATQCTGAFAGKSPEFLGLDDECVLFTVNYGENNDIGRSICLAGGVDVSIRDAWVGTYNRKPQNAFYRIAGDTGKLDGPYPLPDNHHSYGCAVDSSGIVWSADVGDTSNSKSRLGSLAYVDTGNPSQVGSRLETKWAWTFYGIAVDPSGNIWLGGYKSKKIFRYRPNRPSFADLKTGTWTAITQPSALTNSRGIAIDNRGKVWVAIQNGYVWRVDQSIADGEQDLSNDTNYWKVSGGNVIGVGVDFAGHVWAVSFANDVASRLDVDAQGNPTLPPTAETQTVPVGNNPYTYSDFTGFGLKTVIAPVGRYAYTFHPCPGIKADWQAVLYNATLPGKTAITLRVRSGDTESTLGQWIGPYETSPAELQAGAAMPLAPNPAEILQVEFTLSSGDALTSPTLHDFQVQYSCAKDVE